MVANHRTRASPWGDTPYVRFGMGWFLAVPKLRFQTASAVEVECVAQATHAVWDLAERRGWMMRQRTRVSPRGNTPCGGFDMCGTGNRPSENRKTAFQTASTIEAGCVAQTRTRSQAVCTTKTRMPQNGAPRPNGTGRPRLRGDDISETRLPNLLESRAPAQ